MPAQGRGSFLKKRQFPSPTSGKAERRYFHEQQNQDPCRGWSRCRTCCSVILPQNMENAAGRLNNPGEYTITHLCSPLGRKSRSGSRSCGRDDPAYPWRICGTSSSSPSGLPCSFWCTGNGWSDTKTSLGGHDPRNRTQTFVPCPFRCSLFRKLRTRSHQCLDVFYDLQWQFYASKSYNCSCPGLSNMAPAEKDPVTV